MKNQSTRKLEKDLLKLHTKYFTDTNKLTILHLIMDGKIADAKDMTEGLNFGIKASAVANFLTGAFWC